MDTLDFGDAQVRKGSMDMGLFGQNGVLGNIFYVNSSVPEGSTLALPGEAIDPNFSGIGFTLGSKRSSGLLLNFNGSSLVPDPEVIKAIIDNGMTAKAARGLALAHRVSEITDELKAAYFKNPEGIAPTFKWTLGKNADGESIFTDCTISMQGEPNGHPSWLNFG